MAQLPMGGDMGLAGLNAGLRQSLPAATGAHLQQEIAKALAQPAAADQMPAWLTHLSLGQADLQRAFAGNRSAPLVVLVQDAHGVASAQKNISRTLSQLAQAAPQRLLIGIEGVTGPFDLADFRDATDPARQTAVTDHLLKKGFITGAEHFGFLAAQEPLLWGVEDEKLYEENVTAYRDSLPLQDGLVETLQDIEKRLAEAKPKTFTPTQQTLDDALAAYHAGRMDLLSYITALSGDNKSLTARFPETARLMEAATLEKSINFQQVEKERHTFLTALARRLDNAELSSLLNQSLAYRSGGTGFGAYYGYLRGLAKKHDLPLPLFPSLDRYIQYALVAERINHSQLFEEVDALKEAAMAQASQTQAQRELFSLAEDARLLGRLANHAFGPPEWRKFQSRRDGILSLPGRTNQLEQGLGLATSSSPVVMALHVEPFERFYQAAMKRNQALVTRLMDKAKTTGTTAAVLVIGGFHAPGVEELLRSRGASYITLSPKMTDVPKESRYLDVFASQRTPLETLLLGEKLFLNPPSASAASTGQVLNGQFAPSQMLLRRARELYMSAWDLVKNPKAAEGLKTKGPISGTIIPFENTKTYLAAARASSLGQARDLKEVFQGFFDKAFGGLFQKPPLVVETGQLGDGPEGVLFAAAGDKNKSSPGRGGRSLISAADRAKKALPINIMPEIFSLILLIFAEIYLPLWPALPEVGLSIEYSKFVFASVVPLSMLTRLTWVATVFIHGLGHSIPLWVLDGNKPVMRSMSSYMKGWGLAVVPFFKTPTPTLSVHLKGWKAVFVTFPALAVNAAAVWFFAGLAQTGMADISTAFSKEIFAGLGDVLFVLTTALMATMSLSTLMGSQADWKALLTRTASVLNCGILGFHFTVPLTSGEWETVLRSLMVRGRISGAIYEEHPVAGSPGAVRWVGMRALSSKRGNAAREMVGALKKSRKEAYASLEDLTEGYDGIGHVRWPTGGEPTIDATQPAFSLRTVIAHNGDFDGFYDPDWELFKQPQDYKDIYRWLLRVRGIEDAVKEMSRDGEEALKAPASDSVVIPHFIELLHTQGLWTESVLLAWLRHEAGSLNDTPNHEMLDQWADIFTRTFDESIEQLEFQGLSFAEIYGDYRRKNELLERIVASMAQNGILDGSPQMQRAFAETLLESYLANDLAEATQKFVYGTRKRTMHERGQAPKYGAFGTFGLAVKSIREPGVHCIFSHDQPVSLIVNTKTNDWAYASEANAYLAKVQPDFQLDLGRSQFVRLEGNRVTQYDGDSGEVQNYTLTLDDLKAGERTRDGWIDRRNNPNLAEVNKTEPKDLVKYEMDQTAQIEKIIYDDWHPASPDTPRSHNLMTFDNLVEDLRNKYNMRLDRHSRDKSKKWDVVIVGSHNSYYIAETFKAELEDMFEWLNVGIVDANELLKNPFAHPQMGLETIPIILSSSGQNFGPLMLTKVLQKAFNDAKKYIDLNREAVNGFSELRKNFKARVYVVTGEVYSEMGRATGQTYDRDDSFKGQIFHTHTPYGLRRSEAITLGTDAMLYTLRLIQTKLAKEFWPTTQGASPKYNGFQTPKDLKEFFGRVKVQQALQKSGQWEKMERLGVFRDLERVADARLMPLMDDYSVIVGDLVRAGLLPEKSPQGLTPTVEELKSFLEIPRVQEALAEHGLENIPARLQNLEDRGFSPEFKNFRDLLDALDKAGILNDLRSLKARHIIEGLEKGNKIRIQRQESITGVKSDGTPQETKEHAGLRNVGQWYARFAYESILFHAATLFNLFVTFAFSSPVLMALNFFGRVSKFVFAIMGFQFMTAMWGPELNSVLGIMASGATIVLNMVFFFFFPFLIGKFIRYFLGMKPGERLGTRKLVILDVDHVHNLAREYNASLWANSYGWATVAAIQSGNPLKEALHRFGRMIEEGGPIFFMGFPNGRSDPDTATHMNAVRMVGGQLSSIKNKSPLSPGPAAGAYRMGIGTHAEDWEGKVGDSFSMDPDGLMEKDLADAPPEARQLVEAWHGSDLRLSAFFVLFHAMQQQVNAFVRAVTFGKLGWDASRTQGGTRNATTQSPVKPYEALADEILYKLMYDYMQPDHHQIQPEALFVLVRFLDVKDEVFSEMKIVPAILDRLSQSNSPPFAFSRGGDKEKFKTLLEVLHQQNRKTPINVLINSDDGSSRELRTEDFMTDFARRIDHYISQGLEQATVRWDPDASLFTFNLHQATTAQEPSVGILPSKGGSHLPVADLEKFYIPAPSLAVGGFPSVDTNGNGHGEIKKFIGARLTERFGSAPLLLDASSEDLAEILGSYDQAFGYDESGRHLSPVWLVMVGQDQWHYVSGRSAQASLQERPGQVLAVLDDKRTSKPLLRLYHFLPGHKAMANEMALRDLVRSTPARSRNGYHAKEAEVAVRDNGNAAQRTFDALFDEGPVSINDPVPSNKDAFASLSQFLTLYDVANPGKKVKLAYLNGQSPNPSYYNGSPTEVLDHILEGHAGGPQVQFLYNRNDRSLEVRLFPNIPDVSTPEPLKPVDGDFRQNGRHSEQAPVDANEVQNFAGQLEKMGKGRLSLELTMEELKDLLTQTPESWTVQLNEKPANPLWNLAASNRRFLAPAVVLQRMGKGHMVFLRKNETRLKATARIESKTGRRLLQITRARLLESGPVLLDGEEPEAGHVAAADKNDPLDMERLNILRESALRVVAASLLGKIEKTRARIDSLSGPNKEVAQSNLDTYLSQLAPMKRVVSRLKAGQLHERIFLLNKLKVFDAHTLGELALMTLSQLRAEFLYKRLEDMAGQMGIDSEKIEGMTAAELRKEVLQAWLLNLRGLALHVLGEDAPVDTMSSGDLKKKLGSALSRSPQWLLLDGKQMAALLAVMPDNSDVFLPRTNENIGLAFYLQHVFKADQSFHVKVSSRIRGHLPLRAVPRGFEGFFNLDDGNTQVAAPLIEIFPAGPAETIESPAIRLPFTSPLAQQYGERTAEEVYGLKPFLPRGGMWRFLKPLYLSAARSHPWLGIGVLPVVFEGAVLSSALFFTYSFISAVYPTGAMWVTLAVAMALVLFWKTFQHEETDKPVVDAIARNTWLALTFGAGTATLLFGQGFNSLIFLLLVLNGMHLHGNLSNLENLQNRSEYRMAGALGLSSDEKSARVDLERMKPHVLKALHKASLLPVLRYRWIARKLGLPIEGVYTQKALKALILAEPASQLAGLAQIMRGDILPTDSPAQILQKIDQRLEREQGDMFLVAPRTEKPAADLGRYVGISLAPYEEDIDYVLGILKRETEKIIKRENKERLVILVLRYKIDLRPREKPADLQIRVAAGLYGLDPKLKVSVLKAQLADKGTSLSLLEEKDRLLRNQQGHLNVRPESGVTRHPVFQKSQLDLAWARGAALLASSLLLTAVTMLLRAAKPDMDQLTVWAKGPATAPAATDAVSRGPDFSSVFQTVIGYGWVLVGGALLWTFWVNRRPVKSFMDMSTRFFVERGRTVLPLLGIKSMGILRRIPHALRAPLVLFLIMITGVLLFMGSTNGQSAVRNGIATGTPKTINSLIVSQTPAIVSALAPLPTMARTPTPAGTASPTPAAAGTPTPAPLKTAAPAAPPAPTATAAPPRTSVPDAASGAISDNSSIIGGPAEGTTTSNQTFAQAQVYRVVTDAVRIRAEASTESAQIGLLKKGSLVATRAIHNNWIQVEREDGEKSWIKIDFAGEVLLEKVSWGGQAVVIPEDGLYVRAGPGRNHKVLTALPVGVTVEPLSAAVDAQGGVWIKIPGDRYVSADYLDFGAPQAAQVKSQTNVATASIPDEDALALANDLNDNSPTWRQKTTNAVAESLNGVPVGSVLIGLSAPPVDASETTGSLIQGVLLGGGKVAAQTLRAQGYSEDMAAKAAALERAAREVAGARANVQTPEGKQSYREAVTYLAMETAALMEDKKFEAEHGTSLRRDLLNLLSGENGGTSFGAGMGMLGFLRWAKRKVRWMPLPPTLSKTALVIDVRDGGDAAFERAATVLENFQRRHMGRARIALYGDLGQVNAFRLRIERHENRRLKELLSPRGNQLPVKIVTPSMVEKTALDNDLPGIRGETIPVITVLAAAGIPTRPEKLEQVFLHTSKFLENSWDRQGLAKEVLVEIIFEILSGQALTARLETDTKNIFQKMRQFAEAA